MSLHWVKNYCLGPPGGSGHPRCYLHRLERRRAEWRKATAGRMMAQSTVNRFAATWIYVCTVHPVLCCAKVSVVSTWNIGTRGSSTASNSAVSRCHTEKIENTFLQQLYYVLLLNILYKREPFNY